MHLSSSKKNLAISQSKISKLKDSKLKLITHLSWRFEIHFHISLRDLKSANTYFMVNKYSGVYFTQMKKSYFHSNNLGLIILLVILATFNGGKGVWNFLTTLIFLNKKNRSEYLFHFLMFCSICSGFEIKDLYILIDYLLIILQVLKKLLLQTRIFSLLMIFSWVTMWNNEWLKLTRLVQTWRKTEEIVLLLWGIFLSWSQTSCQVSPTFNS